MERQVTSYYESGDSISDSEMVDSTTSEDAESYAFIVQVSDLISKIRHTDRKFRRAKRQIILLNNQIQQLVIRYHRAEKEGRKSFKFTMRSQCATLEGVRNMYFEYAKRQCEIMDRLQNSLKSLAGEEYDVFGDLHDQ